MLFMLFILFVLVKFFRKKGLKLPLITLFTILFRGSGKGGVSRNTFWFLVLILFSHSCRISGSYLAPVSNDWTWNKTTPQKIVQNLSYNNFSPKNAKLTHGGSTKKEKQRWKTAVFRQLVFSTRKSWKMSVIKLVFKYYIYSNKSFKSVKTFSSSNMFLSPEMDLWRTSHPMLIVHIPPHKTSEERLIFQLRTFCFVKNTI